MTWREYWNRDSPIYVSTLHKHVHYRRVADDIERLLEGPHALVLDYGCGEALSAERLARRCDHLYLCDGADLVRRRLSDRLGSVANVTVLAPEDITTITDRSLDLIVVNSVVQYLSREALTGLLAEWRRKLTDTGRLVIADVLPRDLGATTDAAALMRFAWQNGFLFAAIGGLGRTFFSDYRRMRAAVGLTHYEESEMLTLLARAGFTAGRLERNLGHNAARMAFWARPAPDAKAAM